MTGIDLTHDTSGSEFGLPKSYSLFRSQLNLVGESYEIIRLALWYYVLGGLLRKFPIEFGRIRHDTRCPLFIMKPPGQGGAAIKNSLRRILDGIEKVSVPTSHHEEQLIGKMIHVNVGKKDEKTEPNYGYLKDAYVIFDEARPLILRHEDRYDRFWSYVNIALDAYGLTPIEKRGVNDPEALRYFPEASPIFITQLVEIPNAFVSRGVFRRFLLFLIEVSDQENREINRRRLREHKPSEDGLRELQKHLFALKKLRKISLIFDEKFADAIYNLTQEILELAGSYSSPTVAQYADSMRNTIPELALKMAAVLAIDEAVFGKTVWDPPAVFGQFEFESPSGPTIGSTIDVNVSPEHGRVMREHLRLFMDSAFDLVDRFVSKPQKLRDISKRMLPCLRILKDRGCVNESTGTESIGDYQREIARVLKCSESTARSIYGRLKQKGLINSKQIGSYGSRVWLTPEGLRAIETDTA